MELEQSLSNDPAKGTVLPVLKWALFLIAAGLLAWRMVVVNLADHFARQDTASAATSALSWYPHHPQALYIQGRALMNDHPSKAEQLLRQAAQENPTDGRVYMALAHLWEQRGELEKAANLVTIASQLAPMRSAVQLQAASFWFRQGQLERALQRWGTALDLRPQIRASLYPQLLRLAEDPQAQPAFAVLLNDPPSWWESFFSYAAANAANLETLWVLYQLRSQNGHTPSATERSRYMARLQRNGLWMEAYFTWLNSLDAQQLAALGNIYNGSFELPFSGEGFDWRTSLVQGVMVETALTSGGGNRALHVVFEGRRVPFKHLYQYLLLQPGNYQLRGQARPEGLQTAQGVQWTLRCIAGGRQVLGTSERFLGSDEWRQFTIEFTVPVENCQVQELRLELIGRFAQEFAASGAVWFDDLRIRRIN